MPSKSKMVCELCHIRPATRHKIYGDTGIIRAMCSACFEQEGTSEEVTALQADVRGLENAKCDYCGASAVSATAFTNPNGHTERQFWCMTCLQDLADFNSRPENGLTDFDVDDEIRLEQESIRLAERERRRDEFMRERVIARKQKGVRS